MNEDCEEVLTHLRKIDQYEFERFVAKLWEKYGWKTEVTSDSNDHGIDFIAEKNKPFNQRHIVQVKRWGSDNKVGSPDIQQYSSLRHRKKDIDAVVVVTTSSFSTQAIEEARDLNVKMVDGSNLYNLIIESDADDLIRDYTDIAGTNEPASPEDEYMTAVEGDTVEFNVSGLGKAHGEVIYVENRPNYKDLDVRTDSV